MWDFFGFPFTFFFFLISQYLFGLFLNEFEINHFSARKKGTLLFSLFYIWVLFYWFCSGPHMMDGLGLVRINFCVWFLVNY